MSFGTRIKFQKHGNLLASCKVYTYGDKSARLILDPEKMEYYISDPVTGFVFESGGGVTNLEVLQRKAKKALKKYLGTGFEKEKRNVRSAE